jgi:hypothetical protein
VLSREEEVAALAVEVWADARFVRVAKEAVQDWRFVEPGDYEAADVGEQGDEDCCLSLLGLKV